MTTPLIESGIACLTMPGQFQSGDRYLVQPSLNGLLVAVVDGLGHGEQAAAAADRAVTTLINHTDESVIALVKRCHHALRDTRGVVMSLASFNKPDWALTWIGIGNVEGLVLRAEGSPPPKYETLLLRGGVVGDQLPSLSASIIPLTKGDTLVFTTDGIRGGFAKDLSSSDPAQVMADRILAKYSKDADDALVFVVRFLK